MNAKNILKKHRKKRSRKKKPLGFFKKLFLTLLVLVLIGLISTGVLVGYYYPKVPVLDTTLFEYSQNAIIYDRYGQPYQNLEGEENRQSVQYEALPEVVKNAFIAIEDKRFYEHHGIDLYSTARAISEVFLNRNLNGSGGSTITQQLIKQTHLTSERSLERKFDEWILAYKLEDVFSKEEILTAYLNKINFHGAEGIQAAAQQYFNKNVEELSLAEAAVLAAIPNSPSYYDPYTYSEAKEIIRDQNGQITLNPNNKERAFEVLDKMYAQGYIQETDYSAAKDTIETNLGLVFNNPYKVYSHFTDALYEDLLGDIETSLGLTEEEAIKYINTSGLKIYSTVDTSVQSILEENATKDTLIPEQSETAKQIYSLTGVNYEPELAMTVINNSDGSVVGMVGGRTNNASLTLNRATQAFQTGSVTKPLTTYAPALEEEKVTLASVYNDVPIKVDSWQPNNSDGTYSGPLSVREGLVRSINTIAVQTLMDIGPVTSREYGQKLGLVIEEEDLNPSSLALGGYTTGQSTLQMAAAYSTFASDGTYTSPYLYTRVEDRNGNIIISHVTQKEQVFSPEVSYLITDTLKEACTTGTASIDLYGTEVAGKTGTTDSLMNAWFCGYTPTYSTAIWYGYDTNVVDVNGTNYYLNIETAGGNKKGPAGMFQEVMEDLELSTTTKTFTTPFNITKVEIDKASGLKPTELTDKDPRGSQRHTEYFIKGTEPTKEDNTRVLTSFDTSTSMKSGKNCLKSNIEQKALIDMSKISFPYGVTPLDTTGETTTVYNYLESGPTCNAH